MSNAPAPEAHSSVVGGSTAERRIACPGSYKLEQKLPPSAKNDSSEYADEGTALHEAMAYILTNGVTDLDDILGMTFGADPDRNPTGYVMTQDLVDHALAPCVDFFDALEEELIETDGDFMFLVECRVEMPGIPNAFGTSDIVFRTPKRSGIVDWKFGVGVPVKACYKEDDVERANHQLAFYARSGVFSLPHMFGDDPKWPVDLYIVQPRGRDIDPEQPYTYHQTTIKALEDFRRLLVSRVAEAMGDEPRIIRSKDKNGHCKFCKVKPICPAHLGPAIDATKLADKLVAKRSGKGSVLDGIDINWSVFYGELLDLGQIMEALAKEITAQAHAFADEGNVICDEDGNETWKLVQKRPSESYKDEAGAVTMAKKMGVAHEDCFTLETKSPAQLRSALAGVLDPAKYGTTKKAREEAAKGLIADYTVKASSGTTLAPASDDRRTYIPTAGQVHALSNKLASLVGK
jgi:hypothetical protein